MQHAFEILLAVVFTTVWRLVPFRPPNVEPMLATLMPLAKRRGVFQATLFSVLGMVVYDFLTSGLTQWTAVTAAAYGIVALGAALVLTPERGVAWYAGYAVAGTLVFDFLTGVAAGAVLFGMSWKTGLLGQIPFTVNHLIGNVSLSVALSPVLEWALRYAGRQDAAVLRAVRRMRS